MAYKRQIDRLPIIPADAKEHNVVCHYCIVGCGYKAYTWDMDKQGTTDPSGNKFGVDLSKQQGAETEAWYAPSMYNVVRQNGRDVHIVIKPDKNCVVNSGLGSIRGARMAEMSYSPVRNTEQQRLTDPMVWRYGQMQPTSWEDALDLVARVTAAVIDEQGEDGLFVSAFDHGGAGGGYENTWGTGKLYFGAMKVKNIRIHNRPAYNSEVHATRDMGVGELNNCYEDAELADTIVAVGANSLETQTNYFLNHWVPNLRGTSMDKKKRELPNEPHEPARVIIVDPRRTVTINACEVEAGKDRVMHLAINSGHRPRAVQRLADLHRREGVGRQGIHRRIDRRTSTRRSRATGPASRRRRGSPASRADEIRKSAEWIAQPKAGGARRRTMFAYEKGLIWGNDNYRTNGALVNVALATGNIGRPGGGCVRLGGHQEGYSRPSDAHVGKPAAYVDQLLISGKGGVHHIWGCDHYKTTLNALKFKQAYKKRTDMVKDAMSAVPWGDRPAMVAAIMDAIKKGGLFAVDVDIIPTQIGQASHVWLPAATSGEMNLTSMNGERRMRLTERYMDPPGRAMPDCLIAARIANNLERVFREHGQERRRRPVQGLRLADRRRRLHGRLPPAREGRRVRHLCPAACDGHQRLPGACRRDRGRPCGRRQLAGRDDHGTEARHGGAGSCDRGRARQGARAAGDADHRGGPARAAGRAERIIGTKRLYADGKFNTKDGKAVFMETKWRGLQAPGKEEELKKFPFLDQQRAHQPRLAERLSRPGERIRDGPLAVPVHRDEPAGHGGAEPQGGRSRRGLQRQRLDPGDGLSDRAGQAEADLHAVRLPDGRAGQRGLRRGERVHHPELQADLGEHPQAR